MTRPKLQQSIIDKILTVWINSGGLNKGFSLSSAEIHRRIQNLYGEVVSLRKVQQIISEFKKSQSNLTSNKFPVLTWEPENENSQNRALLFKMRKLKTQCYLNQDGINSDCLLYEHEAKWAIKNHYSLSTANDLINLLITLLYSNREKLGYYIKPSTSYKDLDSILTWQPWLGGSYFRDYENSILLEISEQPNITFVDFNDTNIPTVCLEGVDALLFGFCSIIYNSKTINCMVQSTNKFDFYYSSNTSSVVSSIEYSNTSSYQSVPKILKGENFLKNENQTIRHLKRKEKIELANWLANSHNIQGKESEYGKSWEYEIAETYGGK